MRCIPSTLLLAVALVASGSCLAQQAAATTATTTPARADAATAAAAEVPAGASTADAPTRSAFGKVIAIMISSLQREARDSAQPARPVHTSAAGTPLGIEVGDAFRSEAASSVPPAAHPADPATVRPDYAVRQPSLAGPG